FSSRRRHTRSKRDWSSDVCSSDLGYGLDDPMLGPLISAEQHERVSGFLSEVEAGQIVTGDRRPVGLADDLAAGAFITPTLVDSEVPQTSISTEDGFTH